MCSRLRLGLLTCTSRTARGGYSGTVPERGARGGAKGTVQAGYQIFSILQINYLTFSEELVIFWVRGNEGFCVPESLGQRADRWGRVPQAARRNQGLRGGARHSHCSLV